jgi:hypothetical protein
MAYFPLAMTHMSPTTSSNPGTATNTAQNQSPPPPFAAGRFFDPARAEEIIRTNGGYEMVISPLYKRFLAEAIDTIILFIVKILFFVFFLDYSGLDMYDTFEFPLFELAFNNF